MTSSKVRSAGLGAVATFAGFAASLGGAAAAHADPSGAAFGTDQETTPCAIAASDIQFAPAAADGKTPAKGWQEDGKTPVGGWESAAGFHRLDNEPAHGILVKIKDDAKIGDGCSRIISLASYTAQGKTWQDSKTQSFVDVTKATLDATHTSATLVVKLPTSTDALNCFGQLDLYFGEMVYDGQKIPGHGSLPSYPKIANPPPADLISAWNGADSTSCSAPSSSSSSSSSSPATSSSSSAVMPSSPPSSTPSVPSTPTATGSTSVLPTATTSSSTGPALAHTGSNAGVISLVALTFFGAGGATVLASRKAAAARKH
jgi:hypothetical protein